MKLLAPLLLAAMALAVPTEPIVMPQCDQQINTTLPAATPFLPDPFNFLTSKPIDWNRNLWGCRRQEIMDLFQEYELGWLPPAPSNLSATLSQGNLSITASHSGKSITWVVPITYPTSGSGPFPAMMVFTPQLIPLPANVAVLNFNITEIAWQTDATDRGKGKFYDLYGSDNSAGAMIAWTWAVSRIFDALEMVTNHNLDLQHIGATGCSRYGKGVVVAAAFEERIALAIPQESGAGGTACWRIADYAYANGLLDQTLEEIVTENVWFSTELDQFVNQTDLLPFDHHMLMGLIAPRGLLSIGNSGVEWVSGSYSQYGCELAARTVYQALGVPANLGISQSADHAHCTWLDSQTPDVNAFIDKFLFEKNDTDTNITKTVIGTFNYTQWINWDVPTIPA